MNACDEHDANILLYLDDELAGSELEGFLTHLEKCSACRERIHEERVLSDLLSRSRPLYTAPDTLRARVAAVATGRASITSNTPMDNGNGFYNTPAPMPAVWNWSLRIGAFAAALVVIVLALRLAPAIIRHTDAAAFVDTAVAVHQSYSENQLPLEIFSDSPAAITAWFAGRVPFQFRLPVAETAPDWHPAYHLTGARLVRFKRNDVAAFVSYQAKGETITLLVAPEKSAKALGGDEVRSGGLTFHYITRQALSVIIWNTHGLTYALVSSIRDSAQHSCLVCHQSMVDKSHFQ